MYFEVCMVTMEFCQQDWLFRKVGILFSPFTQVRHKHFEVEIGRSETIIRTEENLVLIFPYRENTGNLSKTIKMFLHREFTSITENCLGSFKN